MLFSFTRISLIIYLWSDIYPALDNSEKSMGKYFCPYCFIVITHIRRALLINAAGGHTSQ